MEQKDDQRNLFSLLAGVAAVATLAIELYYDYLRINAGNTLQAMDYILVVSYICLIIGCFIRKRIVLGIGFVGLVIDYVPFAFINLSWAAQNNYYATDLKLLVAFQFSTGVAALVVAIMCFFKKASGRPLLISGITFEIIYAVTRIAYLVWGITSGFTDLSGEWLLILYVLVYSASVILAAVALYKGEFELAEPATQSKQQAMMSAGELLRLHSLMEEGVLSQEEFDTIKSKFVQ